MSITEKIFKNLKFYVLIVVSITSILTISSRPENLLNNNLIKNNLYENILFTSTIFPLIIFSFLILFNLKKFTNLLIIKNNFIYIIFILLLLFQTLGTISTSENYIINLYYTITPINILLISSIYLMKFNTKSLNFYFCLNLIVFFFIFLYFFFIYLKYYLLFNNNVYSVWGNIKNNESVPRTTGMARFVIIFSIYYTCVYISEKKNLYFLIFFNYLIFAFQSRAVILSLVFISLIIILIKEKISIMKIFKYLILVIILPFIISVFIDYSKRQILFDNDPSNKNDTNKIRLFDPNINNTNFTSNRLNDWKKILENYDKKKIFGYGIHGDRILINQTASNGFIYSFASGGYLAAIIYCIICVYSLFLLNMALLKKKFDKFIWFASFTIIFFLTRSLVENSFTIISFDFIIFFLCIFYLEKVFFFKSKFNK
jgi:hypothetical protein